MQDHVKFLVVDDVPAWADQLKATVSRYFEGRRLDPSRVRGFTAYDADDVEAQIASDRWDLVLLDMNLLGDGKAGAGRERRGARMRISGLDLLEIIARGNRAFFVIIVTGAATDPHLDRAYGSDTAGELRYGAMTKAMELMPPERVRILHKPGKTATSSDAVKKAMAKIHPQLHASLDAYCEVSRERNIFRALPGKPDTLEIRFDGGPRLTLPFEASFKTIQSALAQPNRRLNVITLMQRIARSSETSGPVLLNEGPPSPSSGGGASTVDSEKRDNEDAAAEGASPAEGIGIHSTLSSSTTMSNRSVPMEAIIGGLLEAQKAGCLAETVNKLANVVSAGALRSIPGAALQWAKHHQQANAEFGEAADGLVRLARELTAVLASIHAAESAHDSGGRKKIRVARGRDTKEMQTARQHWMRFTKRIREYPDLEPFYEHIVAWVDRSADSRGHLVYRPPPGEQYCPFWLTE